MLLTSNVRQIKRLVPEKGKTWPIKKDLARYNELLLCPNLPYIFTSHFSCRCRVTRFSHHHIHLMSRFAVIIESFTYMAYRRLPLLNLIKLPTPYPS